MGKLTLDKMGLTMPVMAPIYGWSRWRGKSHIKHYRNLEIAMVVFEADEDAVLDILPPDVEPANSPPRCNAWVSRAAFVNDGIGGYDELEIVIYAKYKGETYAYVPKVYVSPCPEGSRSEIIANGEELGGCQPRNAWITLESDLGQMIGCVERPKGKRLVTLTVQPEVLCRPEDIPMGEHHPGLLLRYIPNTEAGKPPAVCELLQFKYTWAPKINFAYLGSGSLTFDSPSDIDPLYKLGPTRIVSAMYYAVDTDIPQGIKGCTLKNYLEDWKWPTSTS